MNSRPKAVPRPQNRRRERLESALNPQPRPQPQIKQTKPLKCPDPSCSCSGFMNEDDKVICETCGAVVQEYSMVTDVQYGMTSGGRHVVHGHKIGADQAYNRNAMLYDRNKQTSSEEITNLAGKRYMTQISAAMGVQANLLEAGMQVFRLATAHNFIQGRRTKSVAAVCLYVACRTQRDNPNQHMLIDFSDVLELNVFRLGVVYKDLVGMLQLNPNGYIIQPINPEDLILRFAQRLEFGNETMRVANEAVRIVQRMNRDWMTPGRRPAGICGAALFLAARMNNFRRTVREVVYVVKVQEQTINKRIAEFKVTESSNLSVDDFRTIDLESSTDPPAFYEQKEGKKKRGRKPKITEFDDDGDEIEPSDAASRLSSVAPSTSNGESTSNTAGADQEPLTSAKRLQAQADRRSMPPPPVPIDPTLLRRAGRKRAGPGESSASDSRATTDSTKVPTVADFLDSNTIVEAENDARPPKKRRGRPPKNPQPDSVSTTASEDQLTSSMLNPLNLDPISSLQDVSNSNDEPELVPSTPQPLKDRPPVPMTPEIGDDEFSSDPEVANCMLTPEEVIIKTRYWTQEHHDYLRAQSAKLLKQQMEERNGTARVIKRRVRRRGRVGDLRPYRDGQEAGNEDASPVADTADEAVMRMLGVRAYSKKLNYEFLREAYTPSAGSMSRRSSNAGAGSPGSGFEIASSQGSPEPDDVNGDPTVEGRPRSADAPPTSHGSAPSPAPDTAVAGSTRTAQQQELEDIVGEMEKEGVYDDDPVTDEDAEDNESEY